MDALAVVEPWRSGGSVSVPAGGNVPRPRPRQQTVAERNEEAIVAQNNRALAALSAQWSGFKVG